MPYTISLQGFILFSVYETRYFDGVITWLKIMQTVARLKLGWKSGWEEKKNPVRVGFMNDIIGENEEKLS